MFEKFFELCNILSDSNPGSQKNRKAKLWSSNYSYLKVKMFFCGFIRHLQKSVPCKLLTAGHQSCLSVSFLSLLLSLADCSLLVLSLCFFLSLLLSLAASIHWFAQFCCQDNNCASPHNASFIPVLADQNLHMLQTPSHQRQDA